MFDHSIEKIINTVLLLCAFEQSLYVNDHCCMLTIVVVLINIRVFSVLLN